jgi:hypothetical protein
MGCVCLGRDLIRFIALRLFAVVICGTSELGGVPCSYVSGFIPGNVSYWHE